MCITVHAMGWLVMTPSHLPGALDGGPGVACHFKEIPMSHVIVAYYALCPLSILRNGHVSCQCHYDFQADVVVTKAYVALSNLRNAHVTLSILKFEGHLLPWIDSYSIQSFRNWRSYVTSRVRYRAPPS